MGRAGRVETVCVNLHLDSKQWKHGTNHVPQDSVGSYGAGTGQLDPPRTEYVVSTSRTQSAKQRRIKNWRNREREKRRESLKFEKPKTENRRLEVKTYRSISVNQVQDTRTEYQHVPDAEWDRGQNGTDPMYVLSCTPSVLAI